MVEILEKLGIKPKRWPTEELKKIYLETKAGMLPEWKELRDLSSEDMNEDS